MGQVCNLPGGIEATELGIRNLEFVSPDPGKVVNIIPGEDLRSRFWQICREG